jgi:hypothetical protein
MSQERAPMPGYFFNCEGAQTFTDSVGTELRNDAAACVQAVENADQVIRDHAAAFALSPKWRSFVTDGQGRVVFDLKLNVQEGP